MSRLIDADKLKIKHFVQRGDQPIEYEGTQPVYEYTDLIAYDVDNAPTVKAIPIEFIKAFSECLLDRRERFVLETLIEVWEGKRETKVPYINQMLEDWGKENGEI